MEAGTTHLAVGAATDVKIGQGSRLLIRRGGGGGVRGGAEARPAFWAGGACRVRSPRFTAKARAHSAHEHVPESKYSNRYAIDVTPNNPQTPVRRPRRPNHEAGGYLAISHAQYLLATRHRAQTQAGEQKQNVAELCSQRRRSKGPLYVLSYNHKHGKRTKASRRRVASLSDKVVAFLLRDAVGAGGGGGGGVAARASEMACLSAPIVSPDLQRATNTQPDRERNCNENAPSCVITAAAALRNGLRARRRRSTFDFITSRFGSESPRNRSCSAATRLWTLLSGYKHPSNLAVEASSAVYLARIASRSGCFRADVVVATIEYAKTIPTVEKDFPYCGHYEATIAERRKSLARRGTYALAEPNGAPV
ncbi:unnamed protein product, partial [Iphiclides podalirius]